MNKQYRERGACVFKVYGKGVYIEREEHTIYR